MSASRWLAAVSKVAWTSAAALLSVLILASGPVRAEGTLDGASLRERIARLRTDAESIDGVRTAIEQAEVALTRLQRAREANDVPAAERALRIAEAATTLAERRSDLARERRLSRTIAERKRQVQEETVRAREALAAQRARMPNSAATAESP